MRRVAAPSCIVVVVVAVVVGCRLQIAELFLIAGAEAQNIVRRDPVQTHARDALMQHPPAGAADRPDPSSLIGPAPGGSYVLGSVDMMTKHELLQELWHHADPLPSPKQIVAGIPHKNRDKQDEPLWEMVRALASRKMHYLKKLEELMARPGRELAFTKLYPNLQFDKKRLRPLDEVGQQWYVEHMDIDPDLKNYAKHIVAAHDGEVRLVGDWTWEVFPDADGQDFTVFHRNFWHYQFMESARARRWMFRRSRRFKDEYLLPWEAAWILQWEENQTTMIKFVPAAGGGRLPASDGDDLRHGTFYIKKGHHISLAELFRFGAERCTCFDLYKTFLHLPIVVHKRQHSISDSEAGIERRAAKQMRFDDTGRYGLPKQRGR